MFCGGGVMFAGHLVHFLKGEVLGVGLELGLPYPSIYVTCVRFPWVKEKSLERSMSQMIISWMFLLSVSPPPGDLSRPRPPLGSSLHP